MTTDSKSWIGALLRQTGLPAAVFIALGALCFGAGLLEPLTLSNRKLALGTILILCGLLWQAGSNWRFQHSEDSWPKSLVSVYFVALIFWTGLLGIVVGIALRPAAVRSAADSAAIEIRDVTVQRGQVFTDSAEWRIRATVLARAPALQKGSALVYLSFNIDGGPPPTSVGFRNFDYTTVWLSDGSGVFVVNTVGPIDRAPTPTWKVLGYTGVVPATLSEPAK